jgi:prepilin-type N-terminal cleavage/methylation domain-containing protein
MMIANRFATTRNPKRASRAATGRRGYTLLEICVAMIVFSIALTGLVPLVAVLSRDLQPYKTSNATAYKCSSPARDGNTTGSNLVYSRHEWYFTSFDNNVNNLWVAKLVPWTRKLGASADVTTTSSAKIKMPTIPVTVEPSELVQDDCDPSSSGFASTGMTWVASGGYKNQGYHKIEASTDEAQADVATWTLTVVNDGWYSVQATWPTDTGLTLAKASYRVTVNSDSPLAAREWDQGAPGTDGTKDANNSLWWPVTSETTNPYLALNAGDTVTVKLTAPKAATAGKFVIADAVRIVQNTVKIKSIERSLDGTNNNSRGADATVQASVTVNVAQ